MNTHDGYPVICGWRPPPLVRDLRTGEAWSPWICALEPDHAGDHDPARINDLLDLYGGFKVSAADNAARRAGRPTAWEYEPVVAEVEGWRKWSDIEGYDGYAVTGRVVLALRDSGSLALLRHGDALMEIVGSCRIDATPRAWTGSA